MTGLIICEDILMRIKKLHKYYTSKWNNQSNPEQQEKETCIPEICNIKIVRQENTYSEKWIYI
jgi:hypothetical protein